MKEREKKTRTELSARGAFLRWQESWAQTVRDKKVEEVVYGTTYICKEANSPEKLK